MKMDAVFKAFELAGITGPVSYNAETRRLESDGVLIDESRLVDVVNQIMSEKSETGKLTAQEAESVKREFDSLELQCIPAGWTVGDVYRAGFCRALKACGIDFTVFDNGFPRKLEIKK